MDSCRDIKGGEKDAPEPQLCTEFARMADEHGWSIEEYADLKDGVWVVSRSEQPASTYKDDIQNSIANVVDSSFWYRIRNHLLLQYLDRNGISGTLWDIGSGTGVVSRALSGGGYQVVAIEPGRGGAISAAAYGVTSVSSTLEDLQLPTGSVSAIGLFDVIEHLPNSKTLLAECHRVLSPTGQLFLSVPAHTWLWSQTDVLSGHQCRYSRRSLRTELETSAFVIHDCSYRLASLVIPMALIRSIPWRLGYRSKQSVDQRQLAMALPRTVTWITRLERLFGNWSPFGTSLFACASPRQ